MYLSGKYGKENNGKMCMVCISKGAALCCIQKGVHCVVDIVIV